MYIMSQDGKSLGEYQLITVRKLAGTGRKDHRYGIYGYCHAGNLDKMLTDPAIGEYDSEERAHGELEAIFAAMERGDRTYRLR